MAMAAKLVVDGYEFHCVQQGNGQPVLLVHGSVSDHRSWQAQIDALSQRFRVIAYSRRYHWPNTPIAAGTDYAMSAQVTDLEAVIGTLAGC
jgi:pimeloyl-ACP methyl ester carboxylesterase